MQQVLDSLDSDSPDIQLRTAIALSNRMSRLEPINFTPDVTPDVTPYVIDCPRCGHCCPQRPLVELTMLDMAELRRNGLHAISDKHFRAIEAKIKEKNT